MNILTKISIVVLVVLSLFVSTVFITYASVSPKYAEIARSEKTRADINLMHANNQLVANQALQHDLVAVQENLAKAQTDAKQEKQNNETAMLAVQNDLANTKRDLTAEKSKGDRLAVAIASLSDRLKSTGDELTATRTANDKLAEDNRKLTQSVQETTARLEREARQGEYYQEQIADLQKQIEEARRTGGHAAVGATDTTDHVAAAGEERYTGTVTSVRGELASINIGSSNGVKKGDKLYVYRAGKFLAYLKVEEVDANNAAGIITDRAGEISQGDKVTNKLQ